jgi:F0F1-type ATP synthase membrane subunit b/b'
MEENKEGKSEKFFKDFGKKVDQFLSEAKEASSKLDADMQKKYEELKESAEKLRKEAANKERWKEVEEGLKRAGEELEKTLKAAFRKREDR